MKGEVETESVENHRVAVSRTSEGKENHFGSESYVPGTVWNWFKPFKWETELIHLSKAALIVPFSLFKEV